MPAMTTTEQITLAAEIVREPREELADALRTATRQWQAASTSAEMLRWNATMSMYRHALALRDALAEMR